MRRRIHIEAVALALRTGVHGEVLWGRNHAVVIRIVALHAFDKVHAYLRCKERIFAVGLLPASPARIAKDVDVWRPEGQAVVDGVIVVAQGFVVFGSRLGGDHGRKIFDQRSVPGSGHADGLRETRSHSRRARLHAAPRSRSHRLERRGAALPPSR